MWVLILGDMSLFAIFFVAFQAARTRQPDVFATAQRALDQGVGATNVLVLLTSSLLVAIGVRATRQENPSTALFAFAGALVFGACFVVLKAFEYCSKVARGITPRTNEFFMYYYALTGVHLFHVLVGMSVLVWMCVAVRRAVVTQRSFAYIEGGGCFWHMVDALWIVLFPLIYLVGFR